MRRQVRYGRESVRERSFGRLVAVLFSLVILTGAAIIAWLFLSDTDLLLAGPPSGSGAEGPVQAVYRFEDGELTAPRALVARVSRPPLGAIRKLDLMLPWPYQPGTAPDLPATARQFEDWLVLSFETGDNEELTVEERYGAVYPVYFNGDPQPSDGNLLRYDFRQDSPYADIQLFVGNADGKPAIHRCDVKPSSLGPILCERRIRLSAKVWLRYRFTRKHLKRWHQIEADVRRSMAAMFSAAAAVN